MAEEQSQLAGVIQRYPQLREMDPKHAAVLLMFAAGMPAQTIADYCECSRASVYNIVNQYKVSDDLREGLELQKLLLANQLGSIAVEIMGRMHCKRSELAGMPFKQLVPLLSEVLKIQKELDLKIEKQKTPEHTLVENIAARIS